jgi:hypothetical protein
MPSTQSQSERCTKCLSAVITHSLSEYQQACKIYLVRKAVKVQIFAVHFMAVYMGSRSTHSFSILRLAGNEWITSRPDLLTPGTELRCLSNGNQNGPADMVTKIWVREKYFDPSGIRMADLTVCSLATVLTSCPGSFLCNSVHSVHLNSNEACN